MASGRRRRVPLWSLWCSSAGRRWSSLGAIMVSGLILSSDPASRMRPSTGIAPKHRVLHGVQSSMDDASLAVDGLGLGPGADPERRQLLRFGKALDLP